MAKRKRRASARKKTASKRGKARTRIKSSPRKSAKRAGRKTRPLVGAGQHDLGRFVKHHPHHLVSAP